MAGDLNVKQIHRGSEENDLEDISWGGGGIVEEEAEVGDGESGSGGGEWDRGGTCR